MPTIRLTENDKDWAIVGAVPADAEGITYIYGRQSCDTRSMEEGDIDVGNAKFAKRFRGTTWCKVERAIEFVIKH